MYDLPERNRKKVDIHLSKIYSTDLITIEGMQIDQIKVRVNRKIPPRQSDFISARSSTYGS